EDRIVNLLSREGSLDTALLRHLPEVQNMFAADGVAVVHGTEVIHSGRCPDHAAISKLVEWNLSKEYRTVFATHELSVSDAPAEVISPLSAGVLAMTLSDTEPWMVLWFRAEAIEVINWAGNPHSSKVEGSAGALTPRASFNSWSETVRGKARRWRIPEIEAAERLASAIQNVWQTRRISDLNKELLNLVNEKEILLKQKEFLLGEV